MGPAICRRDQADSEGKSRDEVRERSDLSLTTKIVQYSGDRCMCERRTRHEQVTGETSPEVDVASLADKSSQFFITYAKQPSLDGKYTIFGK